MRFVDVVSDCQLSEMCQGSKEETNAMLSALHIMSFRLQFAVSWLQELLIGGAASRDCSTRGWCPQNPFQCS